jgi:hypothetical protein
MKYVLYSAFVKKKTNDINSRYYDRNEISRNAISGSVWLSSKKKKLQDLSVTKAANSNTLLLEVMVSLFLELKIEEPTFRIGKYSSFNGFCDKCQQLSHQEPRYNMNRSRECIILNESLYLVV